MDNSKPGATEPTTSGTIRLTQTVTKGGCAAKVAARELRALLSQVRFPAKPVQLLVDSEFFDDAGVYQVDETTALVQTLDFFTPIVDDPYLFGQVAAANALSDVYAMGGLPKTAMGILCMPVATMPSAMIVRLLQGAADKVEESGACMVGGHSIDDDTLKFGLSVTGYVHPQKIWSNAKAREGDLLILTKPLGTGTATAALKRQEVTETEILDVTASMTQLNHVRDLLTDAQLGAIHAATDVTGFGLAGHGLQMAKASGKSLHFDVPRLPSFANTMHFLEKRFLTKAHRSNSQYVELDIRMDSVSELRRLLLFDPQTSGGLLLAVAPSEAAELCANLRKRFPRATIVGKVTALQDRHLFFQADSI